MSRGSFEDLTPTSFAMLGLLAIQPWTTYELAKQMQRSVHWFWPRAERKLYDEPKHLAALGLVSTRSVMTGKRASTVYEITADGRAALHEWVAAPTSAPPLIEMEAMIRLFFAENGTPDQMLATLHQVGSHATAALGEISGLSAAIAEGDDAFPDRRATNAVSLELYTRLHETILEWSKWAAVEVTTWPEVRKARRSVAIGPRERGRVLFADIVRRAERASRVGAPDRARDGAVDR
jgi:PadR family transcriptional regulator, regulatory protein AphA